MTTIGFIGAGRIGGTVARLGVDAGHDVVMSNCRGPATLGELVAGLGPHARAATSSEAAAAGDLVVVTIPMRSFRSLPAEALRGKVVIDTCNYYPRRDGQVAELDDGSMTSSELLQGLLPESLVVKVFNNIYFDHLGTLNRPSGSPDRTALPIAGDDPAAKATVARRLDDLGYVVVDAGPLSEGWRYQPGTPAYGTPYAADPSDWVNGGGRRVTTTELRERLAEAGSFVA